MKHVCLLRRPSRVKEVVIWRHKFKAVKYRPKKECWSFWLLETEPYLMIANLASKPWAKTRSSSVMTHIFYFCGAVHPIRFVCFFRCIIIGEVGSASKMNLVLQLMMGVAVAGVAEGMALADRAGLQQRDVLEIFELTTLACPLLLEKGKGNTFLLFFFALIFSFSCNQRQHNN